MLLIEHKIKVFGSDFDEDSLDRLDTFICDEMRSLASRIKEEAGNSVSDISVEYD